MRWKNSGSLPRVPRSRESSWFLGITARSRTPAYIAAADAWEADRDLAKALLFTPHHRKNFARSSRKLVCPPAKPEPTGSLQAGNPSKGARHVQSHECLQRFLGERHFQSKELLRQGARLRR